MKRATIWILAAALCCWSAAFARAEDGGKIRVACVGDSITANNYPADLGRVLGPKYEVRNFGVSGTTMLKAGDSPYWKTGQFRQVHEFEPQIIIIALGTNDTKPQNWKHAKEFAADIRAMVDDFAAIPSKPRVWLCHPVPVVKDNYGINERVLTKEVIPAIEEVAKEKNLPEIDLYKALSGVPKRFPDGVHPDGEGQEMMAKAVARELTRPMKIIKD
jgi:acyl-CoA thioesterase-1